MSDARLQQLRRTLRANPSLEGEARYLTECVRAGLLSDERLALAGFCGHEAAAQAAGTPAPYATRYELYERVKQTETPLLVAAAVAAARVASDHYYHSLEGADFDLGRAVRAAEDALADPSEANTLACRAQASYAGEVANDFKAERWLTLEGGRWPTADRMALHALWSAHHACLAVLAVGARGSAEYAIQRALGLIGGGTTGKPDVTRSLAARVAELALREVQEAQRSTG